MFGHHGAPVLVFPTSKGKFYEYEDRGMVGALNDHLERGWIQLYCVESVDAESTGIAPGRIRPAVFIGMCSTINTFSTKWCHSFIAKTATRSS